MGLVNMQMVRKSAIGLVAILVLVGMGPFVGGCGDVALLVLNPSFVNQSQGGLFPLVPRQNTGLLLARVVNSTDQSITFQVTIERAFAVDVGDMGGTITETETIDLFTVPGALSSESGVLFTCTDESPITRIGLGRNLNQPTTDSGLFIGGAGDIIQGFGVPANINPLSSIFGDFRCGDTIVFQSIVSTNAPGGFKVQAFVLSQDGQPSNTARNTFQVAADFFNDRPSDEQ
jgi:hypothetical protein